MEVRAGLEMRPTCEISIGASPATSSARSIELRYYPITEPRAVGLKRTGPAHRSRRRRIWHRVRWFVNANPRLEMRPKG